MRILRTLLFFFPFLSLSGQALISPWTPVQFFDDSGNPLANGRLYQCVAGQSCPGTFQATFTSSSGFTQNPNPIILTAGGRVPTGVWLTPNLAYKFTWTTATGTIVGSADNVLGSPTSLPTPVVPGIPTQSIQFNLGNTFAGSANLTWDNTNQVLRIAGVTGLAALITQPGYIQSYGGFVSVVQPGGSWQGFNTPTDGALMRGYHLAQSASNQAGGYIDIAPITYNPNNGAACTDQFGNTVRQPVPLNGLTAFGTNDVVLWVGQSPVMPASGCGPALPVQTTYGLDTNGTMFARGGFATDNSAFNSIQSLLGGASVALGVTMGQANYFATQTACTNLNAPASGYGGFGGYTGGTHYCYWNGTAWASVDLSASGGGATPGTPVNSVQFNTPLGTFSGSANLLWDNTNRLLTITALDSAHPGLAISGGFAQSDAGFYATLGVATSYQTVNAPSGGAYAKSITAINYTATGSSNGIPPLTAGQSVFPPGTQYCDTGSSPCVPKLWNGSAWVTLSSGGATSPGGLDTYVQFNSAGSFGGSSNLTYSGQLLNSTSTSSTTAGMSVKNGFMQAENGFLAQQFAVPTTPLGFNVIQAPTGGMLAESFTAKNYVQLGNYSSGGVGTAPPVTSGDTFHQGACGYDTFGSVSGVGGTLRCFDGANWNAIGSGGGGSPVGPAGAVQFTTGSAFNGSGNLSWNNGSQSLTVGGIASTSALTINNGAFIQLNGTTAGVNAATATAANAIQAPNGGLSGKWLTASDSLFLTQEGTPALSGAGQARIYASSTGVLQYSINGAGYVTLATGGVPSINSLTGALTIAGTTNEVNVSSFGTTITLSTPQAIATSSTPTFAGVVSSGVFNSTASGTTFQNSSGNFQVNSSGALSLSGVLTSQGGLNVTTTTATNSIQSSGGVNVGDTGSANGVYQVNGSTIINSAGQFVGAAVLATGNVQTGGVFAVSGGFFGASGSIVIGGCTISIQGGIIYSHSGC